MAKGTKRASPGAEDEKNPLQDAELGEEDAKKLEEIAKYQARAELAIERDNIKKLTEVYAKRRPVLKAITNFWPVALFNHQMLPTFIQHNADQTALSYLEDIWVTRDPQEHRCYSVEFHFKENQFFSDSVLTKTYKYVPPPTAANDKADENGITDTMLEFSWERDVAPSATKINWKDPSKALTKLYPREVDEEGDPTDPGSFFNFFEHETDPFEIGNNVVNEVFADAVDYFLNRVETNDSDISDDEESDDDDAEEIDLEKPRAKKQRV